MLYMKYASLSETGLRHPEAVLGARDAILLRAKQLYPPQLNAYINAVKNGF
jgi:hypothetical protein